MSLDAKWTGVEGAAFERVSMVFESLGYQSPQPDSPNGTGAYVMSIVSQYQADLSKADVHAIIRYALTTSRAAIHNNPPRSLRDLGAYYE